MALSGLYGTALHPSLPYSPAALSGTFLSLSMVSVTALQELGTASTLPSVLNTSLAHDILPFDLKSDNAYNVVD